MEALKIALVIGIFAIAAALIVVGMILYSYTTEEEAHIPFYNSAGENGTINVTQEKHPYGICGTFMFTFGFIVFILAIIIYSILKRSGNEKTDEEEDAYNRLYNYK